MPLAHRPAVGGIKGMPAVAGHRSFDPCVRLHRDGRLACSRHTLGSEHVLTNEAMAAPVGACVECSGASGRPPVIRTLVQPCFVQREQVTRDVASGDADAAQHAHSQMREVLADPSTAVNQLFQRHTDRGGAALVGEHGGHCLGNGQHAFADVIGGAAHGPRGHFVDQLPPVHMLGRRQVLDVLVDELLITQPLTAHRRRGTVGR